MIIIMNLIYIGHRSDLIYYKLYDVISETNAHTNINTIYVLNNYGFWVTSKKQDFIDVSKVREDKLKELGI